MSVKRVLLIDDDDITENVERLRRKIRDKGFTLSESVINLSEDRFKMKNDNSSIILDFDKIKQELTDYHMNEAYDLVSCDYYFPNNPFTGFDVIKWLMNVSNSQKYRIRRAKFFLHSSQGDKIVRDIKSVQDIKQLIKLRLTDFIERENLSTDLSKIILNDNNNFDFSRKLLNEFDKYPDFEFKSVYPKFKGKKLEEIAIEIDKEQPNGIDFQSYLAELTIAHMIELNKPEVK